jgi:hypothetical protein
MLVRRRHRTPRRRFVVGTTNKTIQASEGEVAILERLQDIANKLGEMHQEIVANRLLLTKTIALAHASAESSTAGLAIALAASAGTKVDDALVKRIEEVVAKQLENRTEGAIGFAERLLAAVRDRHAAGSTSKE